MKNLLRNSQLLEKQHRHQHYHALSRTLLRKPDEQDPPKAYFKVEYLPDSHKNTSHGFYHYHMNPFVEQAITAYDNWEYAYYGQWWTHGSTFSNLIFAIGPIGIICWLGYLNQNLINIGETSIKKYYIKGGNFMFEDILVQGTR
ncbi:hypothetical protein pb186bvf_017937 [Paramecium bursaria]